MCCESVRGEGFRVHGGSSFMALEEVPACFLVCWLVGSRWMHPEYYLCMYSSESLAKYFC